jgi:hypothetical protein
LLYLDLALAISAHEKCLHLKFNSQHLSVLIDNIEKQRIPSPKAMDFCHSDLENGKKIPANPVNPV